MDIDPQQRDAFQKAVTAETFDVFQAWEAYHEMIGKNAANFHIGLIIDGIRRGVSPDATTVSLGVFSFERDTVSKSGEGKALEGLGGDELERAKENCKRMIEVANTGKVIEETVSF